MLKEKVIIIIMLTILFDFSSSYATKCLKATNLTELRRDFPIIIIGKIENKQFISNSEGARLNIKVIKYLKGNLKKKVLEAIEIQYNPTDGESYEIGKEYIFPISKTKKKPYYEVIIQQEGCPKFKE